MRLSRCQRDRESDIAAIVPNIALTLSTSMTPKTCAEWLTVSEPSGNSWITRTLSQ